MKDHERAALRDPHNAAYHEAAGERDELRVENERLRGALQRLAALARQLQPAPRPVAAHGTEGRILWMPPETGPASLIDVRLEIEAWAADLAAAALGAHEAAEVPDNA